jgi:hypothetical protein
MKPFIITSASFPSDEELLYPSDPTACGYEVPGMIFIIRLHMHVQLAGGGGQSTRCCHCWKLLWNFCCGIAFSAVVTFLDVFCLPKCSSL